LPPFDSVKMSASAKGPDLMWVFGHRLHFDTSPNKIVHHPDLNQSLDFQNAPRPWPLLS
jgi:hypothetical protein